MVHVRARLRDDSGVIAVIVAVFAVVMFGLAALVVDLGLARETKREAQSAADAAALAGAGELYDDTGGLQAAEAIDAVKDVAAQNFGTTQADWSNCSATLESGWTTSAGGTSTGTSCIAFYTPPTDADGLPNELRVVVPGRDIEPLFGGIVGFTGEEVGASAQASAVSSQLPSCTLCVLGDLDVGDAAVTVTGGGSLHAGFGVQVTSNGRITVQNGGGIAFTGNANPASGPQYTPGPPQTNSGQPVKDPFESRSMPSTSGVPDSGSDSVACGPGGEPSLTPGRYHDITIKNVTCPLADGLYVITGELNLESAFSRVEGERVTLYFTCGTRQSPSDCGGGSDGGRLEGDRKGVSLGAPYVGGFSLLYDPGNTSDMVLASDGNSFGGAVYARSADVVVASGLTVVDGAVVVGSLVLDGTATTLSVDESAFPMVAGPPEILLTR